MLRNLSLAIRSLQSRKEIKRGFSTFSAWQQQIAALPTNPKQQKLLIIRLDDIGDYLLFRNTLKAYRAGFPHHHITLLGNTAWRSIYDAVDTNSVDDTIWLSKNQYFDDANYRTQFWTTLRTSGYDTVVCASRARPMLLDDCCMLAAAPTRSIASHNELLYPVWNKLSDTLYTDLCPNQQLIHEFHWNLAFASWVTGTEVKLPTPVLPVADSTAIAVTTPYVVCFIGGSKKSHRWPVPYWIELIKHLQQQNYTAVIAGGNGDKPMAEAIVAATGAQNITGSVTLMQTAAYMHQAAAIITNDTMSTHMGISVGRPTLIIANGDNFYKFCGYKEAGIGHADCVYAPAFLKAWKQHNYKPFKPYTAVSKDITTITPGAVIAAFAHLT